MRRDAILLFIVVLSPCAPAITQTPTAQLLHEHPDAFPCPVRQVDADCRWSHLHSSLQLSLVRWLKGMSGKPSQIFAPI